MSKYYPSTFEFLGLKVPCEYLYWNPKTDIIDIKIKSEFYTEFEKLVNKFGDIKTGGGYPYDDIKDCKLVIVEKENEIITKLTFKRLEKKYARDQKITIILEDEDLDNYSGLPSPNYYSK